jgi:hypothetical protein
VNQSLFDGQIISYTPDTLMFEVARMQYLHDAITLLMALYLGHQLLVRQKRRTKRAYVEVQLHTFIRQCLRKDSVSEAQLFKETKQLLMLDWVDANPERTRMDFCEHFDKLVDGHCESFAIAQYLERRRTAASNDGSLQPEADKVRRSA